MATLSTLVTGISSKSTFNAQAANGLKLAPIKITCGGSETYSTGGISFDPSAVGISTLHGAIFNPADGYMMQVDISNKKIKLMYGDYDAAADGKLIELADSTSIADLVIYGILIGQ